MRTLTAAEWPRARRPRGIGLATGEGGRRHPHQFRARGALLSGGSLVAAFLLGVLLACVLLAEHLAPANPVRQDLEYALSAPSLEHWFGTDQLGRDVLSRTIYGARASAPVAVAAVALASLGGLAFGLVAGWYGGFWGAAIMRLADVLLAFPPLLLALALAAMVGRDAPHLALAVAAPFLPQYARVVQAATLASARLPYVEATRAAGASAPRLLTRHLLPGVVGLLVALAATGVSQALLAAAALSFLGLGSRPPAPEWGLMLAEGRDYLGDAWWIGAFPGLALSLTALGVNLLADALHDALDPRRQAPQ